MVEGVFLGGCEVCGEGEGIYYVLIEGAKLWTCSSCSNAGRILQAPAPPQRKTQKKEERELEIVPDYDSRIRNSRNRMRLPLAVVAERINEKEGYLARIEEGKTIPSETIAFKLEKELGIKLFEETVKAGYKFDSGRGKETTLGDLVVIKKKKKEEE